MVCKTCLRKWRRSRLYSDDPIKSLLLSIGRFGRRNGTRVETNPEFGTPFLVHGEMVLMTTDMHAEGRDAAGKK
jgi:hypothetical protein